MVSANVYNIASNEKVSGTNGISGSKEKTKSVINGFDDVFGGYSKDVVAKQNNSKTDLDSSLSKYQGQYSKAFRSSEAKREKVSVESSDKTNDEKVLKRLEKLNDSIRDELKKKLGVNDEQLDSVMEEMGLQFYDLLIPENLTKLVMALTGAEDAISLLNNAEFKDLFKQMADITNILSNELNVSIEQFYGMIEELQTVEENLTLLNENEELSENLLPDTEMKEVIGDEIVVETLSKENETVMDSNNVSQIQSAETVTNASQTKTQEELSKDSNSQSFEGDNNSELVFNISPENQVQSTEVFEAVDNSSQTIDVESIMKQIQDSIRVNVNGQDASMELQLHPESLGKVGISVALKDGVMTAQISAQNEAVKEVIESQVALLREDMNSQGLKVEAIEVTIASHEFEQNLEENNANANDEYSKNNETKGNNNSTSITGSLDEVSEEISLEERIMQENGNSMDISA